MDDVVMAPPLMSEPYLAGFFDGEGSVSIAYRQAQVGRGGRVSPSYVLQVKVDQIDMRPLLALQERSGGRILPAGPGRRTWSWQVSARKARPVLEGLLPYLVVKRRDAEIGLAFLEISRRQGKHVPPTPERTAHREALRQELVDIHGTASPVTNRKGG
jgi:hypothetical protein